MLLSLSLLTLVEILQVPSRRKRDVCILEMRGYPRTVICGVLAHAKYKLYGYLWFSQPEMEGPQWHI